MAVLDPARAWSGAELRHAPGDRSQPSHGHAVRVDAGRDGGEEPRAPRILRAGHAALGQNR